ncbi:MAG TPA: EAL domain-containing protein [Solirubrobacteraceae bacterium]|jgi:diguanylate cyclase (GGDEF)-like protein
MLLPRVDALRAFVGLVSFAGLATLAAAVSLGGGDALARLDAVSILFAVAVVIGECVPLRMVRHGTETEITTSSTFAFALLLSCPPAAAIAAMALGALVSDLARRKSPTKIAFNVGQYVLAMGAAAAVLAQLTSVPLPGRDVFAPVDLPAIALAGLVYFVANAMLVARVITLAEGSAFLAYLRRDFALQTSTVGLLLGLAPIVVIAADFSVVLLPLLGLPLLAVQRAGRSAVEKEQQALHDNLTGLPNRLLFADRVEQAIHLSSRESTQAAVMLIDLDHFKEINDTLGHHAGDVLLQTIAGRLEAAVRDADTVARLGGDEFAVALPCVRAPGAVERVAQTVLAAVAQPVLLDDMRLEVEASVGIAVFPHDGASTEELLRHADVAMYRAKAAGTGHEHYAAEIDERTPDRLKLTGELREALESGELQLAYQPKVSLADGTVSSVEALLRWRHPVRGEITPDRFIPIAEQSGLITALTTHTIRSGASQARAWLDAGLDLSVAVNLSARCLIDRGLVDDVADALGAASLPPDRLTLEITESMIMADPDRAREVLERLRAMGVGLSLDDFGTGYSSLAYLKRLPLDELKIDRSFVSGMDADPADAAIVGSTVGLAHSLGLRVVAEGVEGERVWDQLVALGCDAAQGFFLSRALPPAELARWLAERDELQTPRAGYGKPAGRGSAGTTQRRTAVSQIA